MAAASDELPNALEEAERLINLHAALKEEIGRYEEDYERLQAVNELLETEEAPLPYAALQQWLQKLDVGWNKLLEMWESRREVLVQAHIFHLFLRDVKQAEAFLNNQVRPRAPMSCVREGPCWGYVYGGGCILLSDVERRLVVCTADGHGRPSTQERHHGSDRHSGQT